MKSERGYIIRIRIDWNPNLGEIKSKKGIIPPNGSVIKKENEIIIYKELIYCTIYSHKLGRYECWQGVECEGNPENQINVSIDNIEIPVCSLCNNQLSCLFQSNAFKSKFCLKEEYKDIEREKFIDWLFSNRNKYKVNKRSHKRT